MSERLAVALYSGIVVHRDAVSDSLRVKLEILRRLVVRGAPLEVLVFTHAAEDQFPELRIVPSVAHLTGSEEFWATELHVFEFGMYYDLVDALYVIPPNVPTLVIDHNTTPPELVELPEVRAGCQRALVQRHNLQQATHVACVSEFNLEISSSVGVARRPAFRPAPATRPSGHTPSQGLPPGWEASCDRGALRRAIRPLEGCTRSPCGDATTVDDRPPPIAAGRQSAVLRPRGLRRGRVGNCDIGRDGQARGGSRTRGDDEGVRPVRSAGAAVLPRGLLRAGHRGLFGRLPRHRLRLLQPSQRDRGTGPVGPPPRTSMPSGLPSNSSCAEPRTLARRLAPLEVPTDAGDLPQDVWIDRVRAHLANYSAASVRAGFPPAPSPAR